MIPERSQLPDLDEEIVLRARARAKAAWSAALREDDRLRRSASEQRLAASWPRPRVLPVRSFMMGAAAAACLMLVAFVSFVSARTGGTSSVTVVAPPKSPLPAAPVASLATSTPDPTANQAPLPVAALPNAADVEPRGTTRGMVVTGACPDCRVGGSAMEPGLALGAGRTLSVPRGSRVTLGFAMSFLGGLRGLPGVRGDTATPALVDPAVGIDVEGPASASSRDDQTIALDRGSARFRGLRDITIAVPGGRLDSAGATFTVRVDAHGVARVTVESGRVTVTSQASQQTQDVGAGGMVEVASGTAGANANANANSNASANAKANANAGAPGETERAAFRLAEVEMASGERERGRARLAELTRSSDVRLASDAATLLARSEPTAAGRAAAWERYLATSPPAAYRDRALLERAEALLDAGRASEANAILAVLRNASLSEAQQRQLERLSSKASERH